METNAFSQTRQDASNLKETAVTAAKDLRDTAATHLDKAKGQAGDLASTAVDAAKDLKSTAAGHAEKARGQLGELASHAQSEGKEQLQKVRGQLADVAESAKAYVGERPLAAVGIAFAVGFFFGLSRRRH